MLECTFLKPSSLCDEYKHMSTTDIIYLAEMFRSKTFIVYHIGRSEVITAFNAVLKMCNNVSIKYK